MRFRSLLATMVLTTCASAAKAETTECTEIKSVPITITTQGVYCLKGNLSTSITSGSAINIANNNVTIDFNGFKLGGLAGGSGTGASGVNAVNRNNILIRNGSIRGFYTGIRLAKSTGSSSGHLIENMKIEFSRGNGIWISGNNNIIQNNQILDTGNGTSTFTTANGIAASSGDGLLVSNNFISGVSETFRVVGIYLNLISNAKISGNSIFNILGTGTRYGVYATSSSTYVLVTDNDIATPSTGSFGILNAAFRGDCTDNYVRNFTTALSSCDYTARNDTP